jgi:hypothetical protein
MNDFYAFLTAQAILFLAPVGFAWFTTLLECSPKTDPEVMRGSGAERRRNSHEKEKTYTGRNHQKAA